MDLNEIKAYLESNKDKPDVSAFLDGLSAVSEDKVKGYLETDEGKRVIQPTLDKYHAKSLESWKTNNLDKLVDDEVKKRNPDMTEEQKRIAALEEKLEQKDKEAQREKLTNFAMKQATEKGLPSDLVGFFLAQDEEGTKANLAKFEETYGKSVQDAVEKKFKDNGREIPSGSNGTTPVDSLSKMAADINIRNK